MSVERNPSTSSSGNWDAYVFIQALAAEATAGQIQIPCFPEVAIRIRRALADDNCDVTQLARVVGAEPGLAARLLQMANSAALSPGRARVTELRSAIARIGFAHVRTASLAYSMEQVRNAPALALIREPLNELWERSVRVASMAYVAARSWTSVSADRALLAGMMHAMGRVYILTRSADHPGLFANTAAYQRIVAEWHAPIARLVLESWDIAPDIVAAVEHFEQLDRDNPGEPDLTDVLTIANLLVSFGKDPDALEAQLVGTSATQRMGLSHASVTTVLQESAEELASLHAALGG